MTLSTECEKGHTVLTWGCKSCEGKLKGKIDWQIYLEKGKK